jgi:transcriptional regulator with XRE-family HTH domain
MEEGSGASSGAVFPFRETTPEERATWREAHELVAINVRRVRKARGLSAAKVDEIAGLPARFVERVESGELKRGPTISQLLQIALALSVSPLALVLPWDEGPDEGLQLYVRTGTRGAVPFGTGPAGVEAAARLWTGRASGAFAHLVNVHEFRTTLPSFSASESDTGAAVVSDGGTRVAWPSGVEWYPEEPAFRLPNGLRISLGGGYSGSGDGPPNAKVELLEEGPLFEQLRAAREGAEIEADDDEGGRS